MLTGTLSAVGSLSGEIYKPAVIQGVDIVDVDTTTSDEPGGANTVTFTLSNDQTAELTVYNGPQGPAGQDGKDGADGKDGVDGQDGAPGLNGKDGQDGAPGKDGADGKDGQDGTTYTPAIGTVTTLSAGSPATASVTVSGTTATFDFGIPQGAAGANGTNGTDGDDGTTFTPAVSSAGIISWTNDGGKQNPSSVDLVAAVINALPTAVGVSF